MLAIQQELDPCRQPMRVMVQKDCIDMARVVPLLQQYLGRYSAEDTADQAFAINMQVMALLADQLRIPFTLTMGWFDHGGRRMYEHGEEYIEKLLHDASRAHQRTGLEMHVWLTSPAGEVLDVTLPTTIAQVSKTPKFTGGVIYYLNQTEAPDILYYPTIVGPEFLEKIGAMISPQR